MKSNYIIGLIVLVVVAAFVIYFVPQVAQSPQVNVPANQEITSFNACVDAGYPVTETYPPTCRTPDGKTFTAAVTDPEVVIDSPKIGDIVTSPIRVTGKAKGNWFFEANIPVMLKDENGTVIAQQGMHADGDWMTTDYVNFSGMLSFPTPTTDYGVLIINNDNPSGLPEFDKSFVVPVRFK